LALFISAESTALFHVPQYHGVVDILFSFLLLVSGVVFCFCGVLPLPAYGLEELAVECSNQLIVFA